MSDPDDADRFAGTESYYAEYRPRYGDEPIQYLAERFDLDADSRVLDLGCGAGQIAVPLARRAGEVVGMDPNEAMLAEARQQAEDAGVANVSWVVGSDSDVVHDPEVDEQLGRLDLTTMGRSFHWMDQRPLLDSLFDRTVPGGGVAIVGDTEWLTRGRRAWQDEVYDVAAEYVEDLPERTGPVEEHPGDPWDGLVADAGFSDVTTTTFESEREWDVDGVVGYVLSLSFCSPEILGEDRASFEAELRERLASAGAEPFAQDVEVQIISGRKPDERA